MCRKTAKHIDLEQDCFKSECDRKDKRPNAEKLPPTNYQELPENTNYHQMMRNDLLLKHLFCCTIGLWSRGILQSQCRVCLLSFLQPEEAFCVCVTVCVCVCITMCSQVLHFSLCETSVRLRRRFQQPPDSKHTSPTLPCEHSDGTRTALLYQQAPVAFGSTSLNTRVNVVVSQWDGKSAPTTSKTKSAEGSSRG